MARSDYFMDSVFSPRGPLIKLIFKDSFLPPFLFDSDRNIVEIVFFKI
jgi:hypothetical protein